MTFDGVYQTLLFITNWVKQRYKLELKTDRMLMGLGSCGELETQGRIQKKKFICFFIGFSTKISKYYPSQFILPWTKILMF